MILESESADIAAWSDMYAAAPPEFRSKHNLSSVRNNGALVLTSAGLPLSHFNSAIGLGVAAPASEAQIDDVLACFNRAGAARYAIHIVPGARPAELETWLTARGLQPRGAWERVVRSGEPLSTENSPVELVTESSAAEWAGFIDGIYGLQNSPWLLALVTREGWHHYVLRDSGKIAAARSMYIDTEHRAWLGIDAPVPGLMTSCFDRDFTLCERIVAHGLSLGATAFYTDIEAPREDHTGPAYAGFARLGFRATYLRRHFMPPA